MSESAFQIVANVNEVVTVEENILDNSLDFSTTSSNLLLLTANNSMRKVEIQIISSVTGNLKFSIDDGTTYHDLINDVTGDDIGIFTIYVKNGDKLNFQYSVSGFIHLLVGV